MTPTNEDGVEPPHIVVLDGGFSTQLSCHVGHVIDGDPLWSARFLHTHPNEVVNTHLDFLRGKFKLLSRQIATGSYLIINLKGGT